MKKLLLLIALGIILFNLLAPASALTITSVSSNPDEIIPGEKVFLKLFIENNLGGNAENVIISLDLKDVPFAPYQSSNEAGYDKIDEDDSEDVDFALISFSNAEPGTYKIPVKISYGFDGEEKESTGMIGLIINALPELKILTDSTLIKGMNNDLALKITNSGLGEARLLSVSLEGTGIKILSSPSLYIGNIDSDDSDTAEFKIFVNENALSALNLKIRLSYQDSRNNEINEDKTLQIKTYTQKDAIRFGLIKKSNTLLFLAGIIILIILFFIYRKIRKRMKKRQE